MKKLFYEIQAFLIRFQILEMFWNDIVKILIVLALIATVFYFLGYLTWTLFGCIVNK